MDKMFKSPDIWVGGLYELCIELPGRSEETIAQALVTIWQVPALTGCYLSRDVETDAQTQVSPFDIPQEGHVYGIARLPNGKLCVCGTYVSDFHADGLWVVLYLPLGALGKTYFLGGFPFGDWNPKIESSLVAVNFWLKEIAEAVFKRFQFVFAVIGFESGFEELKKEVLSGSISETRSEGLIIPDKDGLRWYPPTYDKHF